MKGKTKTLLLSALMAGSLLLITVPASAHDDYRFRRDRWDYRDYRGWNYRNDRWNNNNRGGLFNELRAARERLNYDASHHKSRKQLAKDEQNIQNLENQMGGWRRGW